MKYKASKITPPHKVPERLNTVVKSNALIQQSRFSLSATQQKAILYIISQIEPWDQELKEYDFKIIDFCKVCGIEAQGEMYSFVKRQIKQIADKSLWITREDGTETLVRWIEKPYIDRRSGTIRIKLDDDMKPYLIQLRERFTEYELIYTMSFKSKYSIRLYEYLKSIHYKTLSPYIKVMPIEDFQKVLDSSYSNFKDFHTRALKPAHREINEYSDLIFNYDFVKVNKRITEIKIYVQAKEYEDRMSVWRSDEIRLDEGAGLYDG